MKAVLIIFKKLLFFFAPFPTFPLCGNLVESRHCQAPLHLVLPLDLVLPSGMLGLLEEIQKPSALLPPHLVYGYTNWSPPANMNVHTET